MSPWKCGKGPPGVAPGNPRRDYPGDLVVRPPGVVPLHPGQGHT